jgi:hypothetical protein
LELELERWGDFFLIDNYQLLAINYSLIGDR